MIFDHRTKRFAAMTSGPLPRGFGGLSNFGGSWEDYCAKAFPPSTNPEMSKKCLAWSPCGAPWEPLGASCRGLPAVGGNVFTDIVGSLLAPMRLPQPSEYEPINLFHTQLYDPIRFIYLSGISGVYPAALVKGGIAYMSLFTVSPQMFIPGIGGFWQALNQAKSIGGEEYAAKQVIDPAVAKIPALVGFAIDFLLTGWGAFAKKGLQVHADNMPPGDGKAFMTAISQHYGTFTDAIRDPSAWSRRSIYISIGDAIIAANLGPAMDALGYSLLVFAESVEYAMQGRFTKIPDAIFKNLFTYPGGKPVLLPNAREMLESSRRALYALVDVAEEIKVLGVGDKLKQVAPAIERQLDQVLTQLSNGEPVVTSNGVIPPNPNVMSATQSSLPPPPPKPRSAWAPIAVGAGAGLVTAGPVGAVGGAGVALFMSSLQKKKGTTT